jgi:hypothetical protein
MDDPRDPLHIDRNEDLELGLLLGGCNGETKGKDGDRTERN